MNIFFKRTIACASLLTASLVAVAPAAQAHRFWIKPTVTVVSGKDQWIGFDAAISNDLFFANYYPIDISTISITAPDGSDRALQNAKEGRIRSTFELNLDKEGTYRVAGGMLAVRATWEEDGKEKNFQGSADELFAAGIPAKNPSEMYILNRKTETYVTLGAPTDSLFAPKGSGIELVPTTHPNDLYTGEEATFQLLEEGKPLAGQNVDIIPGGDRYRDEVGAIKVTTADDGTFSVTWPSAGRYFFEVDTESKVDLKGISVPSFNGYGVVLEVLPQ